MDLTVSIVLNNYNYARFLRQAIDSALNQTYPHCEVVVVDDGSTDESAEIIRSYGPKIRAVFKENGGQASALNAGFAQARGEIIKFLDSDDYLMPTTVERIVAVWNSEVQILHHRLQIVDANGNNLGIMPDPRHALDSGDLVPLILRQGGYSLPPTSGLAYSRGFLQKVLPMPDEDFRICADSWLLFKGPFFAPVTVIEDALAYYRQHGANAWATAADEKRGLRKLESYIQCWDKIRKLIEEQAAERGLTVARRLNWESSFYYRYRLLLKRAGSSAASPQKRSVLFVNTMDSIRADFPTWPKRLRALLILLTILMAPRFILRRMYPNIFNERQE
jgi:glycosyltransferase involved in cell wall biosynthesis